MGKEQRLTVFSYDTIKLLYTCKTAVFLTRPIRLLLSHGDIENVLNMLQLPPLYCSSPSPALWSLL